MINFDKKEVDIFIVSTPRHWLIATALAFYRKVPAIMLIDNTFANVDTYLEVTSNWEESPFIKVIQLFGKKDWLGVKKGGRRRLKSKEVRCKCRLLENLASQYMFGEVFSASVRDWFCQYAVYLGTKSGKNIAVHYIDDGARTYFDESSRSKKSLISIVSRKLDYGFWYQYPESYQATPWLKSAFVYHPDLVNEDISTLSIQRIQADWFSVESVKLLHKSLFNKLGFEYLVKQITESSGSNVFFVFTKLSLLYKNCAKFNKSTFRDKVYASVENALKTRGEVWIKYHPREESDDVFDLVRHFPNVHLLPSAFAFDLLIPYLSQGDQLMGDMSTVLFDVALQKPMIKVVSLDCLATDSEISRLFNRAGVRILN